MTDAVDSRYSWVVVAVCFVVYFMNFGINKISGLIFSHIISYYNVAREQASRPFLMGSIARAVGGPVSGYLSHRLGFRFAITLGCFLSSFSIFACSFAQDIETLSVLWVICGFGRGLSISILPWVINQFHSKHASKATGISLSGGGIAGILLPFLIVALLDTYGLQGTFLNLSAVTLNAIPIIFILRNPNSRPIKHSPSEIDQCLSDSSVENEAMSKERKSPLENRENILNFKTCSLNDHEVHPHSRDNRLLDIPDKEHTSFEKLSQKTLNECRVTAQKGDDLVEIRNKCIKSDVCVFESEIKDVLKHTENVNSMKNSRESLHLSLPSNETKYNIQENIHSQCMEKSTITNENANEPVINKSGGNFSSVPLHTPCVTKKRQSCLEIFNIFWDPVFLTFAFPRCFQSLLYALVPTILVDYAIDKGISEYHSTYLIMAHSWADLFGKLCLGWITDGNHMSRIRYISLWYGIVAASFGLMAWSNGFVIMSIAAIVQGVGVATVAPAFHVVVNQHFDKRKSTMAIPSLDIFLIPLCFGASPLIGYFRDHLGSYDGLAYTLSAGAILCSVLILSIPTISSWRMKRTKKT